MRGAMVLLVFGLFPAFLRALPPQAPLPRQAPVSCDCGPGCTCTAGECGDPACGTLLDGFVETTKRAKERRAARRETVDVLPHEEAYYLTRGYTFSDGGSATACTPVAGGYYAAPILGNGFGCANGSCSTSRGRRR